MGSIYGGGSKHFFNDLNSSRAATIQDVPNHFIHDTDVPRLDYAREPTLGEFCKDVALSTGRLQRATEVVAVALERVREIYETECQWKKEFDAISKGLTRNGGKFDKIKEMHKETCSLMDAARDQNEVFVKQMRALLESCPKIDEHRNRVVKIVDDFQSTREQV